MGHNNVINNTDLNQRSVIAKQSSVYQCTGKKKHITEVNYKNWQKKILYQDSTRITVFIKMRFIEIVFNLNSNKEFYFYSSVSETETFFGIVIFWVSGEKMHHISQIMIP